MARYEILYTSTGTFAHGSHPGKEYIDDLDILRTVVEYIEDTVWGGTRSYVEVETISDLWRLSRFFGYPVLIDGAEDVMRVIIHDWCNGDE